MDHATTVTDAPPGDRPHGWEPPADEPAMAHHHSPSPRQKQRRYLRSVIKQASAGDPDHARSLLSPFLGPREELLRWGIASRSGVIPRYDFYFLTDRRIGDLEVTPFTGSFEVEVTYLHQIDSITIRQPAIVLVRIFVALMYLAAIAWSSLTLYAGIDRDDDLLTGVGLIAFVCSVGLVHFVVAPLTKRVVLRFLKSGMALRVHGGGVGTFIFADRTKMNEMLDLSSEIAELKRSLDLRSG